MPELLEVAALDAFYGQAQVLFDVGLSVGRGEVVGCTWKSEMACSYWPPSR